MRLAIVGGRVFDPASGWDGQERDIYLADGRVVDFLPAVDQVINARGLAVTPAGLEIRSPVAGFGQNFLRLWGGLPSPAELGHTYALLGYTHVHEPCLTLPTANYVHQELAALPIVDTSASLAINLRDVDLWLQDPQKLADVGEAWAYLLESTRCLNLRVVEPFVKFRQDFYRYRALTEEVVVNRLLTIREQMRLPLTMEATPALLTLNLPVHPGLHLSGLGAALTDEALLDRALHLLATGLTADMGLLPPAPRPGFPSRPVQVDLGWFQPFDLLPELEPQVARRALRLAVQGKEWRLAFSVASLLSLPLSSFSQVFAWLGDAASRRRDWGDVQLEGTHSFTDWLRATRLLPAQYLGLTDRGHLQPGARGDVALYDLLGSDTWAKNCQRCRLLFKAGELVVHNYEVVQPHVAKATYYRRTQAVPNKLVADLCQYRSLRPENLQVRVQPHQHWQQVA